MFTCLRLNPLTPRPEDVVSLFVFCVGFLDCTGDVGCVAVEGGAGVVGLGWDEKN